MFANVRRCANSGGDLQKQDTRERQRTSLE